MDRYEYAFVTLKDNLYAEEAAENLGLMLEDCVSRRGLTGEEAVDCFLASGLARQFEAFNPKFVCGMSPSELCDWMLNKCGLDKPAPADLPLTGLTNDAWLGEILVHYQATRRTPYCAIFNRVSYAQLIALYYGNEDLSNDDACQSVDRLLAQHVLPNRLKVLRQNARLTQQELSQQSGVSLRAIQQYEQGAKDISRAAAATVLQLAQSLGCAMEDLLI